jgi:hypothetical protein
MAKQTTNQMLLTNELQSVPLSWSEKDEEHINKFREIVRLLSEPFPIEAHSYKPIAFTQKGCWVAYYVDLRRIVERVQQLLGSAVTWTLEPIPSPKGYTVKATLFIYLGDGVVISYEDFGYADDESTEGYKSAATDALRRVFSHLGLGRYLYHLPKVFITGEKHNGGYRYDVEPLAALEKALHSNEPVLFFGSNSSESAQSKAQKTDTLNENQKRWIEWNGGTIEDVVQYIKGLAPDYTEKQITVFTRLVPPTEDILEELMDDANTVRRVLDERLGSRRDGATRA